jgi:hypothetical protein
MKLNFELLNALITYCKTPRSSVNIEEWFRLDHDSKETKAVLTYAIKQKLLTQAPEQVKHNNKCPSMWVTQANVTKLLLTGVRNV